MKKIFLYQTVRPQDGSAELPRGPYEVDDIKWITAASWDTDNEENVHGGLATFVVASGEFAGLSRRIGVIVEEEFEGESLVVLAGWGIEEFESAARGASKQGLLQAKKLFEEILARNSGEERATWGVRFIVGLLTTKE
jgi:hypothetical protein